MSRPPKSLLGLPVAVAGRSGGGWRYEWALWRDQERLRRLLAKERGWLCEVCYAAPWTDLHHCLLHRRRGVREYDAAVNLQCVCRKCHVEGLADSRDNRERFRERQVERGYDVDGWLEGLPGKVRWR